MSEATLLDAIAILMTGFSVTVLIVWIRVLFLIDLKSGSERVGLTFVVSPLLIGISLAAGLWWGRKLLILTGWVG